MEGFKYGSQQSVVDCSSHAIFHFLSGFDNCCHFSYYYVRFDCLREPNLVISKHAHLAKRPWILIEHFTWLLRRLLPAMLSQIEWSIMRYDKRNMPNKWKWMPFTDVNDIRTDLMFDRVVSWNIQIFSISCNSTRSVGNSCLFLHERGWRCTFSAWKNFFYLFVCSTLSKQFWWSYLKSFERCLFPVMQHVSILSKNIHPVFSENPFKSISNILNDFLNHILWWDVLSRCQQL